MVVINKYDDLKVHILKLRSESAQQAQTDQTPYSRSFHNGMVHACDQIFVALLSWEKSWKADLETRARNRREGH